MTLSSHMTHVFFAQDYLAGNGQPSVAVGVGMTTNGKLAAFTYVAETDTFSSATYPNTLPAEVPHHVALTANSGLLTMYVDRSSNPAGEASITPTTVPGKASLCAIGGVFTGPNSPFNELNAHRVCLGQFAFWNRTLSLSEIYKLNDPAGSASVVGEPETQRMNEILDFINWPSTWRTDMLYVYDPNYDPFGQGIVDQSTREALTPPKWDTGTTALELLQKAASAVDGLIYMGADGNVTYQGRFRRQGIVSALTFRETDSTQIDDTFAYQIDDNDIINKITATAANGMTFEWKDAASIALYGERDLAANWDLLYASDMINAARRRVNRCKAPILRCPTITVDVSATPDSLTSAATGSGVFDIDLGTTIALDDLPVTAPNATINVIVESVSWDIDSTSGEWKVTYEVSPGSLFVHTTLDNSNGGTLDQTTLGG